MKTFTFTTRIQIKDCTVNQLYGSATDKEMEKVAMEEILINEYNIALELYRENATKNVELANYYLGRKDGILQAIEILYNKVPSTRFLN